MAKLDEEFMLPMNAEQVHKCLDLIVACYVTETGRLLSKSTIMDLMMWSYTRLKRTREGGDPS